MANILNSSSSNGTIIIGNKGLTSSIYTSSSLLSNTIAQYSFANNGNTFTIADQFNEISDFLELVLVALGHDIKFEDFKKMTKSQKMSILREIKINKILK